MRYVLPALILALTAVPAFGLKGGGKVKAEPAVVPYTCDDGRRAEVIYESGGDPLHGRALVTLDGRTLEMTSAPTATGLRYLAEEQQSGAGLAWILEGERARLAQVGGSESDAITRCTRLRQVANKAAHEDHSHGH